MRGSLEDYRRLSQEKLEDYIFEVVIILNERDFIKTQLSFPKIKHP